MPWKIENPNNKFTYMAGIMLGWNQTNVEAYNDLSMFPYAIQFIVSHHSHRRAHDKYNMFNNINRLMEWQKSYKIAQVTTTTTMNFFAFLHELQ